MTGVGLLFAPPLSLPVWEEWIEILAAAGAVAKGGSLPVWEEWIEITPSSSDTLPTAVSSRMGRVD